MHRHRGANWGCTASLNSDISNFQVVEFASLTTRTECDCCYSFSYILLPGLEERLGFFAKHRGGSILLGSCVLTLQHSRLWTFFAYLESSVPDPWPPTEKAHAASSQALAFRLHLASWLLGLFRILLSAVLAACAITASLGSYFCISVFFRATKNTFVWS